LGELGGDWPTELEFGGRSNEKEEEAGIEIIKTPRTPYSGKRGDDFPRIWVTTLKLVLRQRGWGKGPPLYGCREAKPDHKQKINLKGVRLKKKKLRGEGDVNTVVRPVISLGSSTEREKEMEGLPNKNDDALRKEKTRREKCQCQNSGADP